MGCENWRSGGWGTKFIVWTSTLWRVCNMTSYNMHLVMKLHRIGNLRVNLPKWTGHLMDWWYTSCVSLMLCWDFRSVVGRSRLLLLQSVFSEQRDRFYAHVRWKSRSLGVGLGVSDYTTVVFVKRNQYIGMPSKEKFGSPCLQNESKKTGIGSSTMSSVQK